MLGVVPRTLQRWQDRKEELSDQRKGSRAAPANKISDLERQEVLRVLNSAEFGDSNPNQIVPNLADQGMYIGSESSLYRILKQENLNIHRQPSKAGSRKRPDPHVAIAPNQVWSWDITYLASTVEGIFFYQYMVIDIYSRKAVACQVYDSESADRAAALIEDACLREGITPDTLTLHSDNGSPMRGSTMLEKLRELGVSASFSRPSVSDDNPFSESLFRTEKYRPNYPENPFDTLLIAREWSYAFVEWYNNKHLHSGIRFVTPADRHSGKDVDILYKRRKVYEDARKRHPERWSGKTRNWDPIKEVTLNKGKNTKMAGSLEQKSA